MVLAHGTDNIRLSRKRLVCSAPRDLLFDLHLVDKEKIRASHKDPEGKGA